MTSMLLRIAFVLYVLRAQHVTMPGMSGHLVHVAFEGFQKDKGVGCLMGGDPVIVVVFCQLVHLLQRQRGAHTAQVLQYVKSLHACASISHTADSLRTRKWLDSMTHTLEALRTQSSLPDNRYRTA